MYFITKKSGHIYAARSLPENAHDRAKKGSLTIIDPDKKRFLGKSGRWASIPLVEQKNKESVATCGRYQGGTII